MDERSAVLHQTIDGCDDVGNLQRQTNRPTDVLPDLDSIHEASVGLVEDLEGGFPHLQEQPVSAIVRPGLRRLQPQAGEVKSTSVAYSRVVRTTRS